MRQTLTVLLCLILVSCSSRAPRGLWSDPSLDSHTLSEGVAIGGLVDLTAELDVYAMQQDARLLEEALRAAQPNLEILPWAEARSILEPDTLDAVLESYRLSGRLSARQLQKLSPLAGKGRYLALSRIDLDQTLWDYTRRTREVGDRTVVDLDPESRRKIALLFDLYDLSTSRLAFTIPVERTAIEHGSVYTVEGLNAVPTEAEIQNAIADLAGGSDRPEPAERKGLIASILKEAVKHLP